MARDKYNDYVAIGSNWGIILNKIYSGNEQIRGYTNNYSWEEDAEILHGEVIPDNELTTRFSRLKKYSGTFFIQGTKVKVSGEVGIFIRDLRKSSRGNIPLSEIIELDYTNWRYEEIYLYKSGGGEIFLNLSECLKQAKLPDIRVKNTVFYKYNKKEYIIPKDEKALIAAPNHARICGIPTYRKLTRGDTNAEYILKRDIRVLERKSAKIQSEFKKKYKYTPPGDISELCQEKAWIRYNNWRNQHSDCDVLPEGYMHPVVEKYVLKYARKLVFKGYGQILVPKMWLQSPMSVLHDIRVIESGPVLLHFLKELAKSPELYKKLLIMLV